jgi:hypothetical protein
VIRRAFYSDEVGRNPTDTETTARQDRSDRTRREAISIAPRFISSCDFLRREKEKSEKDAARSSAACRSEYAECNHRSSVRFCKLKTLRIDFGKAVAVANWFSVAAFNGRNLMVLAEKCRIARSLSDGR